ncbi:uncharacterized protein LOC141720438 isoform X2 [Apium graveolens]|uniref:uncharacterized protein LOC141720438 isoform X2 n=1 Tax=Apium graveolens TaxID=4045 RepID=UPI003D7A8FFB
MDIQMFICRACITLLPTIWGISVHEWIHLAIGMITKEFLDWLVKKISMLTSGGSRISVGLSKQSFTYGGVASNGFSNARSMSNIFQAQWRTRSLHKVL